MSTPSTSWKETPTPDEEQRFEGYAATLVEIAKKRARGGTPRRALHNKGHGIVDAEFTVLDNLPEYARVGMFSAPRTFKAWVRFSNGMGARQSDDKPDIRGVAIKVMGVEGKKLIHGLENAVTQDFLLIHTPAAATGTAAQFMTLVSAMANPATAPFKLVAGLGVGRTLKVLKGAAQSLAPRVPSMLGLRYYSASCIKYGAYAVKWGMKPASPSSSDHGSKDPNWLKNDLITNLKAGPVTFEFQAQFYVDDVKTPIEDVSVEWKETDAPFITLARLTLAQQDLTAPAAAKREEFAEKLSFDPWHTTEDFRPIGDLMRARRIAYKRSVYARGIVDEPTGNETF